MLETFWVNVKISEKRKEKGLVMEEVKMFQPHAALLSTLLQLQSGQRQHHNCQDHINNTLTRQICTSSLASHTNITGNNQSPSTIEISMTRTNNEVKHP